MRRAVERLFDESPVRYPRLWLVMYLVALTVSVAKAADRLVTGNGRWWLLVGLFDTAIAALSLHGSARQVRQLRVNRKVEGQADDGGGLGDAVGRADRATR